MNIKQKIGSAIAVSAMALSMVAPMTFAATITINNNGAFSTNKVKSITWNSNSVSQTTTTVALTGVSATAKTGNNSSSFNTGGTNSVTSGAAANTVGVLVTGGSNTNSGGCGCQPAGTADVSITDNGAFSYNKVVVVNGSSNSVTQGSSTAAETQIWTKASTGGNSASFNTGGSNTVTSGDATNSVAVSVSGGSNTN